MLRCVFIFFICFSFSAYGQKEMISGESVERVFRNPADNTKDFYLVLEPAGKARGLILILPGYGGYPREILDGNPLASMARKEGYVVVIPYLGIETFYIDSLAMHRLETLVPEVIAKFNVPHNKFVIGGHSAGGNAALLYTAMTFRLDKGILVRPNAVFGVDPPLDMQRFHRTVSHEIAIGYRKKNIEGMKRFLSTFENMFGGPPDEVREMYRRYSAYSRDQVDGGNTKHLADVPVRLYCDPDVQWSIEHLGVGYEHLNASDLSECIASLRRQGNRKAELVVNLGKGYFSDGTRNPHASSQLDAKEFLVWLRKVL